MDDITLALLERPSTIFGVEQMISKRRSGQRSSSQKVFPHILGPPLAFSKGYYIDTWCGLSCHSRPLSFSSEVYWMCPAQYLQNRGNYGVIQFHLRTSRYWSPARRRRYTGPTFISTTLGPYSYPTWEKRGYSFCIGDTFQMADYIVLRTNQSS